MATLEFRQAAPEDLDFAWEAYAQHVAPFKGRQQDRQWNAATEKARFAGQWVPDNARIVTVDGEKIGWFSGAIKGAELIIDHLRMLKGNRGMASFVLNIIVLQAFDKNKAALCSFEREPSTPFDKVSLVMFKADPALEFFAREGFSMEDKSGEHLQIDVSGILKHTHLSWS